MRGWDAARVAAAAGAELVHGAAGEPVRACRSTRVRPAPATCSSGSPGSTSTAAASRRARSTPAPGASLVSPACAELDRRRGAGRRPIRSPRCGALAREWRRALGAAVIAVTGSVGKTSTKELHRPRCSRRAAQDRRLARELQHGHRDAARRSWRADPGTEVLVLEAAMRGFGQIATLRGDLRARRRRDHEHRARAPRAGRVAGGRRAGEGRAAAGRARPRSSRPASRCSSPYLDGSFEVVRFGTGGDVVARRRRRSSPSASGSTSSCRSRAAPPADQRARRGRRRLAVGVRPSGRVELRVRRICAASGSSCRGGAVVINDCYNASPLSMRAALDELSAESRPKAGASPCSATCSSWARSEAELHREVGARRGGARASTCW